MPRASNVDRCRFTSTADPMSACRPWARRALAYHAGACHGRAMWYQPSRRICVGIVAALLALGMSWSTVGAVPPAKMMLPIAADGSPPGCCDHRADATDACLLVCLAGAQAVLPAEAMTTAGGSGEVRVDAQVSVGARTVHPDPDPPQPSLLD